MCLDSRLFLQFPSAYSSARSTLKNRESKTAKGLKNVKLVIQVENREKTMASEAVRERSPDRRDRGPKRSEPSRFQGGGRPPMINVNQGAHYELTNNVNDKVMIPQEEHPEINFLGLLIGPCGNILKCK